MRDSTSPQTLSADERGQTLQDYVIGISIFIVVVFVALTFFPNLLEDFQSNSIGDHEAQADRVARQIVTNTAMPGTVNELDVTDLDSIMQENEDQLRGRYGLNGTVNLNITVESLNGDWYVNDSGNALKSQPGYFDTTAGTSARIVTLSDDGYDCSPACRLVVRAW